MLKQMIPFLVPVVAALTSFSVSAQESSEDGAIALSADHASEIGSIAFDRAITDLPILTNGQNFDRIQRIMARLVRSAARPDVGWRMVLVDSDIPDAWVLPDGKMAVYNGILERLHDDQEVASLLTHQMAHSLLGHNMFLLGRNEIQSVLMAQDTGASGSMREQLAYNLGLSIAEGVQVMPYSRMMESEADDLSMVMMLKAGYDPAAAIGTWQWLSDESRFAMEYLSSHPSVSWRIEQMQDQLPCYHKAFEETWGHKPVGLEDQYRESTIGCPPFVTGLMSNIKRDHRDQGEQNYMYDWDDEPGYEAAYYDHVRYNRYFYDDPYYNAWHLGHVQYSFGFRFGGFSYYRWSPLWSGWSYYDPWRPRYVFRIGRGYNHYIDHPYRTRRTWSRHHVTFRQRHYDRDNYVRDEDRYTERRREYKDYERNRDDRVLRSRATNNREAQQRSDFNNVDRKAIESRVKVLRGQDAVKSRNVDRMQPRVQPKRKSPTDRVKSYSVSSKDAAVKSRTRTETRVVKQRKAVERKGVMDFREQAQKQPVRAERPANVKTKTYTSPRRQEQPRVVRERESTSYQSRKPPSVDKQERVREKVRQSEPVRQKAVRQPRSAPKAQSQPARQRTAAPKPSAAPKKSYQAPKSKPKSAAPKKSSSKPKTSSRSSKSRPDNKRRQHH